MDELIRCVACRGTKIVAKLGGMMGDCNTCNGTGKIKACDKPVPVVAVQSELVNDIINATDRVNNNDNNTIDNTTPFAVADSSFDIVAITTDTIIKAVAKVEPKAEPVKLKRKVFKRKVAAK